MSNVYVQCSSMFFLNKSTIFRQTHISYKYGYPDFQTHPYILSIVDFGKAFSTPKPFRSLPVPSCSPGPPGPPCMLSVPRSDVPKSLVITCSAGIWRTWIPALFVSWSFTVNIDKYMYECVCMCMCVYVYVYNIYIIIYLYYIYTHYIDYTYIILIYNNILILPTDAVCCPDINIENVVLSNIW